MITTVKDSAAVIAELKNQIQDDAMFTAALVASINAARLLGASKLDTDLYNALNTLYKGKGWPSNTDDYLSYLQIFAEIIPSESNDVNYDPWKNTNVQNGYSQEVYDRLCHFYYLVDQPVDGKTLQDYTSSINHFSFAQWLDDYADAWGSFLDTEASLTPETLQSFYADPGYNLQDYSLDAPNWTSFNKFFYRQLNPTQPDNSPMRPVANPQDNTIVTSPADCTFKAIYRIDGEGNVLDQSGNPTSVRLKQTHVIGNINDLLGPDGSPYASEFYNGTFVHYFLSPFDYHRFHTPVSGKVLDLAKVPGKVFLDVNVTEGQFDAPDGAENGYEFTQARGVLILDTSATDSNIGKVAVAPIGMAQVSSVHMYTDQLLGEVVEKGTEFGYFAFGGSDIIMVFQQPQEQLKFVTAMSNPAASEDPIAPFHFRYGQASVMVNG